VAPGRERGNGGDPLVRELRERLESLLEESKSRRRPAAAGNSTP
jgi:hypothetical protein